jgi:hypothetical protein
MGTIISGLADQLDWYRSATYTRPANSEYSFQCGCMLFGALTKQMDPSDLIKRPRFKQTLDAICAKVRSIESPTWYHGTYNYHHSSYYGSSNDRHSCNISTDVNSIVDSAVARVAGLSLTEKSADTVPQCASDIPSHPL